MKLSAAIKVFTSKGPVAYPGAQIKANQAWQVLEPFLLPEEKAAIATALSHALDVGLGRKEFDAVMLDVKKRLE